MRSAQSLRLWLDLICGRASLARSDESAEQYFVLDAPPAWTAHRALTDTQSRVVALSAHGAPYKYIANMLGLSPPSVSRALRIAAAKIGVQTPFELIRLASGLAVEQKSELPERTLTIAEEAVLELVILGLSNRAIAQLRGRSTRTIANQVASLLRKMRCPSRRALATSVRPPRANPSEIPKGTDEDA